MADRKCARCELLGRKQRSRKIVYSGPGDSIPVCSVCIQEMAEMSDFFREVEEDESGGESLDI